MTTVTVTNRLDRGAVSGPGGPKGGAPGHPLYLPATSRPFPLEEARRA